MTDCKTCRWLREEEDATFCGHEQAGTLGASISVARGKHGFCGPGALFRDTSKCRVCGQDTRKRYPALYSGCSREDLLSLCSDECFAKWRETHPKQKIRLKPLEWDFGLASIDATNGVDDRHE